MKHRANTHVTRTLSGLVAASLLSACQSHLPALDDYPKPAAKRQPDKPGAKPQNVPKVSDVVAHIQCELAGIVDTALDDKRAGNPTSIEFSMRMKNNPDLATDLVRKLIDYNFVATVQLSLEVTDVEGLNPSLTFQNNAMSLHSGTLGAQWNGTQDRTVTLNYAVDLSRLTPKADPAPSNAHWCENMSVESSQSALQGDLGLADIVADGLLFLKRSEATNVYANSGPTPPVAALHLARSGEATLPALPEVAATKPPAPPVKPLPAAKEVPITIDLLSGTIVLSPQSAGVLTQGTVNFSGVATMGGTKGKEGSERYIANWTGTILPPNSTSLGTASPPPAGSNVPCNNAKLWYFTLSGPLVPDPTDTDLQEIEDRWGFGPTITLTGVVDPTLAYDPQKPGAAICKLNGIIAPVAGSRYAERTKTPIRVSLNTPGTDYGPGTSASPAAKSAAPAGAAAGGTSFGQLSDFVLVYGLNGSPTFTWTHVKAITGASSPFVTAMRTHTDSLAITFVPACRNSPAPSDLQAMASFWDTIGVCDDLTSARDQSQSIGYQNNSLMLLERFGPRPQ
jgi:hypothetical protein